MAGSCCDYNKSARGPRYLISPPARANFRKLPGKAVQSIRSRKPITVQQSGMDTESKILSTDKESITPGAMELSKDEVQKIPKRNEMAATVEVLIKQLSEVQVWELLDRVVENQPYMVLDTLQLMGQVAGPGSALTGQAGPLPQDPAGPPSWCTCKNCRTMPTEEENVCCGHAPEFCLAQMPDMEIKLQPFLLELQNRYQNKKPALDVGKDETKKKMDKTKTEGFESDHATKREAAYRMFAYWWHGTLGAGNTVVIPSCVVLRVRAIYPDNFNNYTQDSTSIVLFDKKMFEK